MTSCQRPWPMLFLCCVLLFNAFGMAFGMGAIFTDIMDTFGVSRATASLVQSLCTGFLFGCGIITSQLLRRFGPRVTVMMGSVLATAGFFVAFFASHIVQVIICIGAFGGFGVSCSFLTAKTLAGVLFHDIKSLALTICSFSEAAGIILYPQLFRFLIHRYSLRGTFLIMAAINCQMILCGALIGSLAPQNPQTIAEISEPRKEAEEEKEKKAFGASNAVGDGNENPRKSGDDEGEDCLCSGEESRVGESVRFLAGNQSAAACGGAAPSNVRMRQDDQDVMKGSDSPENSGRQCRDDSDLELPQEERRRLMSDTQGHHQQDPEEFDRENDTSKTLEATSSLKLRPAEDRRTINPNCCSCCSLGKVRGSSCFHMDVLRDRRFVVISLLGSTAYLFYTQPTIFMTDMVKANQLTVEDGSMFLTIMFVGNVIARLMAGVLYRLLKSDILFAHGVYIAVGGVTCLCFLFTTEYPHFVAVSFILGTGFGFLAACAPINVLEILGPGRFSVGLGYLTTVSGVSLVLSGPFGGLIRDLTQSYGPLYYIACVHGLVLGTAVFFTALRYRSRP